MFSLKNFLLFLLLVCIITMFKFKDQLENFSTNYFHHAKLRETSDFIDERIKMRKEMDGEELQDPIFSSVEHFEASTNPPPGVHEQSESFLSVEEAFNPHIISPFPSSVTVPERKVVDYSAPELHDFKGGNYGPFNDPKESQEKDDFKKIENAFKEAQSDTFYQAIELYKTRGDNRNI